MTETKSTTPTGRPKTPDHLKRERLNIRLPVWMIDRLREEAGEGISLGRHIEDILLRRWGAISED